MFHMVHKMASRELVNLSRSSVRTEKKEEAIRRAAMRLFQTHGFRKVTIREIAREASVSQVTIYNHFGNKDGLVQEVVRDLMLGLMEKYRALIAEDRPFPEKLQDILLVKTDTVGQYGGELVNRVLSKDPEMQAFIQRLYDREIKPLIVGFLDEGRRQGYVNPGLSSEAILSYTDILRRGLMAKPELLENSRRSVRLVRDLIKLYLYGVMGKQAAETSSEDMQERGQHGR
jgi:AcrR family transcriptional regulator